MDGIVGLWTIRIAVSFFFFLIKALASCYSKGKILVYILILTSLLSHNWIFLLDPKLTEFMAIATLNAK